MCTVSVIAVNDQLRLVCNRDESRARPPALPPIVRSCGMTRAIMPIDPESGGTWIAANDAGLALALLNVNIGPEREPRGLFRSRGEIVPQILGARTLADAVEGAAALSVENYRPFRLIVVAKVEVVEIEFTAGRPLRVRRHAIPEMFTSSGLGDHLVDGPRRRLFDRLVVRSRDSRDGQDRFHAHRWPSRPNLSVRMTREDARTVSRTIVDVTARQVVMTYQPEPLEWSRTLKPAVDRSRLALALDSLSESSNQRADRRR